MTRAWRLGRRAHCEPPETEAFNGRGAKQWGGRWNPVGVAAAYASSSRALAALEYLVHLDRAFLPDDLVFAEVAFEETDVETTAPPAGWDVAGSPAAVAHGERWLREQRSLVLAVPSVIVRDDRNYVVNPHHPRASTLVVAPSLEPFVYDERLLLRP